MSTFNWKVISGVALIGVASATFGFLIGRTNYNFPSPIWGTVGDWVMICVTALLTVFAATFPARLAAQQDHQKREENRHLERKRIAKQIYQKLDLYGYSRLHPIFQDEGRFSVTSIEGLIQRARKMLQDLEGFEVTFFDCASAVGSSFNRNDWLALEFALKEEIKDASELLPLYGEKNANSDIIIEGRDFPDESKQKFADRQRRMVAAAAWLDAYATERPLGNGPSILFSVDASNLNTK